MIINAKTYSDFKLLVDSMRHVDAMFYANNVTIGGVAPPYAIAYAFDFQANVVVAAQVQGATFSTISTDFPSAVLISSELLVSTMTALAGTF